ncbi:MAG: hypothetical protein M5R38_15900 [Candidatus Methylomirabilis sp.]|nr:hypothetical protein [Candidatus Methylomirabilis sp.]
MLDDIELPHAQEIATIERRVWRSTNRLAWRVACCRTWDGVRRG